MHLVLRRTEPTCPDVQDGLPFILPQQSGLSGEEVCQASSYLEARGIRERAKRYSAALGRQPVLRLLRRDNKEENVGENEVVGLRRSCKLR